MITDSYEMFVRNKTEQTHQILVSTTRQVLAG